MILLIECMAACVIFGMGITVSVLRNKASWLQEYSPKVQERFLECNPDYELKVKQERTAGILLGKLLVSLLCIALLCAMGYLAGADTIQKGFLNSYIIWFTVNLFDVAVLDLGIFMYWKKIRLPGTENMDKEYRENKWKHIKDGFFGILIGIPVCLIAAAIIQLF